MRGAGGSNPRPLVFSGTDALVQAAAPEPPEVERHPGEPEPGELADHVVSGGRLEESRHVGRWDLEARDAVVVADADLPEAARAEVALRRLDLRQPLGRDRGAVRETGREARARRPVPGPESERAARGADVGLGEARLDQRMADAPLGRGGEPRTVVGQVVDVGTVDDDRA